MAPPTTDSSTVIPQPEAPEESATSGRPMWELAECNCPEFCERDHELD